MIIEIALALLFILLMLGCLALHVFTLPGNWIILLLALGFRYTPIGPELTWTFLSILAGLCVFGEALELMSQMWGAKRYGSTNRGNLGGFVGAFGGAILGAPFFLGIGALVGGLVGAYAGCLIFEVGQGRPFDQARRSATGAFWGKFLGTGAKAGLGIAMCILTIPRIWPG